MPRTLLLPIPHAIADKVHHLLRNESEALMQDDPAVAYQLFQLSEQLDTLAREAGVIGW